MDKRFSQLAQSRWMQWLRDHSPLSAFAQRIPPLYLFVLALTALLGHAFILIFPIATLYLPWLFWQQLNTIATMQDLIYAILTLSATFFTAALTLVQARVRPTPPNEPVLAADQGPKLYEEIDELAGHYHAKVPDLVQVSLTTGVELVRVPMWGYPYMMRNHLVLGLFSLQSLAPRHFRALLARRISRLSWRHFKFSGLLHDHVYIWDSYARSYASKPNLATSFFLLFFVWYAPLYRAMARPAVRRAEVKLDPEALAVINDEDLAETLTLNAIVERYIENRFWPQLQKMAGERETPPPNVFVTLEQTFDRLLASAEVQRLQRQCMAVKEDDGTFTPSLSERLEAIGYQQPPEMHTPAEKASFRYLGDQRIPVASALGRSWAKANAKAWKKLYQQRQKERLLLQKFIKKDEKKGLNQKELWHYSELVERISGTVKAIPIFNRMVKMAPEDAQLHYQLGCRLISVEEKIGRKLLERAVELNKEEFEIPVMRVLAHYREEREAKGFARA